MTEHPYYSYTLLPAPDKTEQIKDNSWFYIGFLVIFLHLAFLELSQLTSPPLKPPVRTKVVVQTVHLSPPNLSNSTVSSSALTLSPDEVSSPTLSIQKKELDPPPLVRSPEVKLVPEPKLEQSEKITQPISSPKKLQNPPPKPPTPKKPAPPKPNSKILPKKENKPAPVKQVVSKPIAKSDEKEAEKKRLQIEKEKKIAAEKHMAEERQRQALAAEQAEKERQRQALIKEKLAGAQKKLAQNLLNRKNPPQISSKLQDATTPKQMEGLQIDAFAQDMVAMASWSVKEANYHDEVTTILKASLRLPDYGAVKIELTIRKTGKVEKVKIISSESTKNRQYVDQNIAQIQFPAFGTQFNGQEYATFPITLNNERKN